MIKQTSSVVRAVAVALASLAALLPAAAAADDAPVWKLSATSQPTDFTPGSSGEDGYLLIATNVGAKVTSGEITITDTLPTGLTPVGVEAESFDFGSADFSCSISAPTVTCKSVGPIHPGLSLFARVEVDVAASPGPVLPNEAEISGGGAVAVSTTVPTAIDASPPPFDFLSGETGFAAPLIGTDGTPATQAGGHPHEAIVDLGFPTAKPGGSLTSAGHLRDTIVELPPGMLANPSATATRCTEAELTGQFPGCPDSSQVGVVTITTVVGGASPQPTPLYNMVPAPGSPATFAFDALEVGIYPHIVASIRSDSDYGANGAASDILARGLNPILDVSLELWGDPSSGVHDFARGFCLGGTGKPPCKTPAEPEAFFTLPTDCSGQPSLTSAHADSWEEPGLFHEATYESADLTGNPVSLSGCNVLDFKPTISVQPTTNLTDSPSGLDADLHQPQDNDKAHLATAALRDATVTLPEGMAVNPSQADGLEACSTSQIGLTTSVGESPVHFSKEPDTCPDAAKLGSLEVSTPLLAQYDAENKLQRDPETGKAIPDPLHGSVYLAKPFENPFGSLLAIYLSIDDPKTGTVAKLAGRVIADPTTGQLTTRFTENPQLPLEDVRLHLFGGARGALITPQSCGAHTSTSVLTPWSSPEGADATPSDSFQSTAAPGGGSCPANDAAAANHPSFQAGTLAPKAGAYSPFVLKVSREDGSQRIAGIDTLLPPGLSGKLAGIAQCSEAQIAQAKSREAPNEGILEKQSPSCPVSSEVGSVDVAAGAGPTPFHTSGHAYLAGPYKGAPLSLAVIVPAVAGPFDLGAVVSRVALRIEPDTAQIHAVSDPLPQIIEGIPLDVRSVAITMGRPQFTLNPTSCDPMQITGSATSALGQSAALSNPFQVGGCQQLPFKPKLNLRLKGGTKRASHPKLIATLKAKPGEANVASAQVKLPPSAFLDQAHIRTVCTRVQFAANTCPKGSIYGSATAVTPLLSDPLSGNVYLRSSNHKLPDLVVALKGPESLPIEIDLAGKTDSVKGALRNTFEAVPDAPVTSFRLELFGGKRGLVINSRNLCAHAYKAEVNLTGQNGKVFDTNPAVGTDCKGKGRKGKQGGKGRGGH